MAKKKITELVGETAAGFLAENGLELYSCEFVKEGKDWFLRVYIDRKPEKLQADGRLLEADEVYVSTDDCEKVSRFLSAALDQLDPIEQNYYLEVSSPGMDRLLQTEEHFQRYAGRQVEVTLYRAEDGRKRLTGVLAGLGGEDNAMLIIQDEENQKIQFARSNVAKVRLSVVF